ncbi:ROK family transcriptional regulator [Kineosporia sp. J2-2]|uniref:ROK family transcriptional regulator n=1 Tax=Kineosporia corallincola TaxID=2835133 RepID=A0ABS5TS12_9ACTN|nr:ROK family transcriptional regulator [Kineosporia corallincola]MBT0773574.1 ROK family transcriptional regulator [Kineosporia corallincola]
MARVGTRPENRHQARFLRLLRDSGPQSRAELGDAVELSKSKVAIEVERLAELGFVDVVGLAASRGGRRSQMVALSRNLRFVGIDIGATSIDVAVLDGGLNLLGQLRADTDVRLGPQPVLDQAIDLVAKVRSGLADPAGPPAGVGVGVPGPVSQAEGALVAPPIMPGWSRFPIRDQLGAALGAPVMVDNDVNVMALGELHAGTARSVRDLLFVKIGTGIGCGIVVGGEIYRGVNGSAGDIGHIQVDGHGPVCVCGNTGCLEAAFGGAALARDAEAAARGGRSDWLAQRLPQVRALSARDVGAAADAGDPVSIALIRDGGARLGKVLASLVSFFNPGLVVIGGGVAGLGHPLLAEIRSVVYRRSLPLATGNLPIVLSELGGTAGVVGAGRLISDSVFATV